MEPNVIISNCGSEYERLIAIVKSGTKNEDIDFLDHCEESTSTMLVELNDLLKTVPPSDEFRDLFKKIHDLNTLASQQISSCEQMQRDNK